MKTVEQRTNVGFEIVCYYPKVNGKYTENTGNIKEVIVCESAEEVAKWFARRSWGSVYEDSNVACPTVYKDGKAWCKHGYED